MIRWPAKLRWIKEWRNASSRDNSIDVMANAGAEARLQAGAGRVESKGAKIRSGCW